MEGSRAEHDFQYCYVTFSQAALNLLKIKVYSELDGSPYNGNILAKSNYITWRWLAHHWSSLPIVSCPPAKRVLCWNTKCWQMCQSPTTSEDYERSWIDCILSRKLMLAHRGAHPNYYFNTLNQHRHAVNISWKQTSQRGFSKTFQKKILWYLKWDSPIVLIFLPINDIWLDWYHDNSSADISSTTLRLQTFRLQIFRLLAEIEAGVMQRILYQ